MSVFALLVQKPSIIIRDNGKVSKQYSATHFQLKNCNDLSTFSLVAVQLSDTGI